MTLGLLGRRALFLVVGLFALGSVVRGVLYWAERRGVLAAVVYAALFLLALAYQRRGRENAVAGVAALYAALTLADAATRAGWSWRSDLLVGLGAFGWLLVLGRFTASYWHGRDPDAATEPA